jgi:Ca2+-binding EF-hand superfamily protein
MMQTKEKLFEIAQKAGLDGYDEATDIDTMRKIVYEHAQQEKPAGVARQRWDGTAMPAAAAPKAATASATASKSTATGLPSDMSSRIFSRLDADNDGKLSKAEMQPMIDQTNAAAQAAGEAVPSDFFGNLDKDKDGSVNRAEADAFFKAMAEKTDAGKAAAPQESEAARAGGMAANPKGDSEAMSAALFNAMDKDGSKDLSRDELEVIIGKANEANKAQGLPEVDFFETMDNNKDGKVDQEESHEFFNAMTHAAANPSKEEL